MEKNIINFFNHQWSFALRGLLKGLDKIIYFLKFGTFIPVTTGPAKGTVVEQNISGTETICQLDSSGLAYVTYFKHQTFTIIISLC